VINPNPRYRGLEGVIEDLVYKADEILLEPDRIRLVDNIISTVRELVGDIHKLEIENGRLREGRYWE
jgi:hypothetical protein